MKSFNSTIFVIGLGVTALGLYGCTPDPQTTGHGSSTSSSGKPAAHFESLRRNYRLKDLQRVTLKANGHDIPVWVMDDHAKEAEGMMWLEEADVKDEEGMIFAFPKSLPRSFWMENTLLPLDIIYISENKKVVSISEGKPNDRTSLHSEGPAMFVLEMKQGSAKRLAIKKGTEISIPSDVTSKIPADMDMPPPAG